MEFMRRARAVNAHYGTTYGGHKAVDNPYWTGVAGDIAARIRANDPKMTDMSYFRSKQYMQHADTLLSSAALNRPVQRLGNKVVLADEGNFDPQTLVANEQLSMQSAVSDSSGDGYNQMLLGGLVVFTGIVFIVYAMNNQ